MNKQTEAEKARRIIQHIDYVAQRVELMVTWGKGDMGAAREVGGVIRHSLPKLREIIDNLATGNNTSV